MTTKTCTKCGETKPVAEFSKDASRRDGLKCHCKVCSRAASAKWQAANPEHVREKVAEWRAANPDKVRESNAKWHAANPDKAKAAGAKWAANNPEKVRARKAKYREENREKIRVASAKYRAENLEKEKSVKAKYREENREKIKARNAAWYLVWVTANLDKKRARDAAWCVANPGKVKAKVAHRRAAKLQATPKWADKSAIAAIYAACPANHHVDHAVPLKGKNVCGLHVPNNLQYLTAMENLSKGNRFNPDQVES